MARIPRSDDLSALARRPRRLLALFPHPDDESYGCAGTLARAAADPDTATVCLILTRGEAATFGRERGWTPERTARTREERLAEVADVLGLDAMRVARHPDGGLAHEPLPRVAATIGGVLDALRPQVVIAHDPRGVNAHPDHIASHWALRHALAAREAPRVAMVCYGPDVAEAARPRLIFPTPPAAMDAIVELTADEIARKERCLRIHEALITLDPAADGPWARRPATECYDFLGEACDPPVADLFSGWSGGNR